MIRRHATATALAVTFAGFAIALIVMLPLWWRWLTRDRADVWWAD